MTSGPMPWPQGSAARHARPQFWGRARAWLLPASLLANVFLVAHAAGPWLRPHRQPGFPGMVEHFAHNLPPEDAGHFRAVMDKERRFFDDARGGMDRSRAALSRAIAATPYDPVLTRARMDDWQSHLHAMSSHFGDTLLTAIPSLSPEGRARLADAADHPPPPGPPPGAGSQGQSSLDPSPPEGPSPPRP